MTDETTRTLEVRTRHEGVFQIEIPVSWKITFGKVNPGGHHDSLALRVYESDDKQRGCFTDVVSFRDLSIPFRRRVKKTKQQTKAERGAKGRSYEENVEHEYEWTNDLETDGGPF